LARRRPAPRYLTAFYMWMSAGGMVGGLGAGLIAPNVFSWVAEYPILIALALLCRPGLALPQGRERVSWIAALVLAAFVLLASSDLSDYTSDAVQKIIAGVLLVAALTQWKAAGPRRRRGVIFIADRFTTRTPTPKRCAASSAC
jgi:hypothetical protein